MQLFVVLFVAMYIYIITCSNSSFFYVHETEVQDNYAYPTIQHQESGHLFFYIHSDRQTLPPLFCTLFFLLMV